MIEAGFRPAYRTIAGVPPVVGLYAAVPSLILYALIGSSRHLVVAPMSATAALSAGIIAGYARTGTHDYAALSTALAIVTGGGAAWADFAAATAAMLGVLVFDTLPGLVIGIGVSLLLLLYRSSRPNVATLGQRAGGWVDLARSPDATPHPGVAVLRVESGLFFANTEHVRQAAMSAASSGGTRHCPGQTMPFIDVLATQMLTELATTLRRDGVRLLVARDIGQVRDMLRVVGTGDFVPIFAIVDEAVAEADRPLPAGE